MLASTRPYSLIRYHNIPVSWTSTTRFKTACCIETRGTRCGHANVCQRSPTDVRLFVMAAHSECASSVILSKEVWYISIPSLSQDSQGCSARCGCLAHLISKTMLSSCTHFIQDMIESFAARDIGEHRWRIVFREILTVQCTGYDWS